jgi:transcriptional regulator GlxA family with amidase domain
MKPQTGFLVAVLFFPIPWTTHAKERGTVVDNRNARARAFLLVEMGLLDGRSATTHWVHANRLSQLFPEIRVNADKLMINHGDSITTGGLMAWVDRGLQLIQRWIGPTVVLATAHSFKSPVICCSLSQSRRRVKYLPVLSQAAKIEPSVRAGLSRGKAQFWTTFQGRRQ